MDDKQAKAASEGGIGQSVSTGGLGVPSYPMATIPKELADAIWRGCVRISQESPLMAERYTADLGEFIYNNRRHFTTPNAK